VIVSAVGVRDMLIGGAILVLVVVPLPLFVRGSTTFSSAPQAQARPVESTV
jgi:hypothetical protein